MICKEKKLHFIIFVSVLDLKMKKFSFHRFLRLKNFYLYFSICLHNIVSLLIVTNNTTDN